jgi:hypothetical protein
MPEATLDDFADPSAWLAVASGLARLDITGEVGSHGRALRLDFDFHGGGGFVVARRPLVRTLPDTWAIRFDVRGIGPANTLELKLADPSGRNVWWHRTEAFALPADWYTLRIRSSEIAFAWGPAGGGAMRELGAIEIALTAGPGGAGTVWLQDLTLEDLTITAPPIVRASSELPGHAPDGLLAEPPAGVWWSEPAAPQRLTIDFQGEREYGGLAIDWATGGRARAFAVETSTDGTSWTTAYEATQADAARSYVYMPATRARWLRLDLRESVEGRGFGIAGIGVRPYEFSRSLQTFFGGIAAEAPRGDYPRYLAREQSYWTPIGVPDGETCALMNEEGMVEVDRGTFSIEPFVFVDGRLATWADAEIVTTLEGHRLPIPSSVWRVDGLALTTTAFALRHDGRPTLFVRHRVENSSAVRRDVRLFSACRPFQVNPPWQSFGPLGGVSPIREIERRGDTVRVNGERNVVALEPPDGFGAAVFEQEPLTDTLRRGELPARDRVTDAFGYASAALRFDLPLPPSSSRDVYLAIPFGTGDADGSLRGVSGAAAFDAVVRLWGERIGRIDIELPQPRRAYPDTLATAVGHVLINRDGPALQPGPRRYTRAWIRDGAIMAAALLRVGCTEEAVEFVRWYAAFQRDDGFVPCVVDANGPDWLVEHDSHGELVFAVAECFRFTGDRAFVAELWPAVTKAVRQLEELRATRLGPDYETPEKRARHGLLPESASHEGYLAQPVHSFWDDFWAVRALGDAAMLARELGDAAEARRLTVLRDAFRESVRTSLALTIAERKIDYVPGSVEWADFDPTATSNAISLLGETPTMPRDALAWTFAEYMRGFRRRVRNEIDWNNYTAYEVRIVGALVHLGDRDGANELADFLLSDRRPLAWNQWPEISWRDPRSPGHIGDVPHAWIGAEYVLSFRTMLAYERVDDDALVVAAGVPATWLDEGEVAVRSFRTYWGTLAYTIRRLPDGSIALSLRGDVTPPGGIVLRPPVPGPLVAVEVDGRAHAFDPAGITLRTSPADVVLRC